MKNLREGNVQAGRWSCNPGAAQDTTVACSSANSVHCEALMSCTEDNLCCLLLEKEHKSSAEDADTALVHGGKLQEVTQHSVSARACQENVDCSQDPPHDRQGICTQQGRDQGRECICLRGSGRRG
jgi:hypothetical protein